MSHFARPGPNPEIHRRRRLAAIGLLLAAVVLVVAVACASGGGGSAGGKGAGAEQAAAGAAPPKPKPKPPPTLPGGGRTIFPDFRVVAFYGHPAAAELGILGIGDPAARARQLKRQAKGYRRKSRPVMPAFELLATIANADPGDDGKYRSRVSDKIINRYYKAAHKAGALLILDIQPGRADFFTETVRLRKWLSKPDVSLALDPEWRMGPGEIPGKKIGSVTSRELNATTAWLEQLSQRKNLPEKVVVIHQFVPDMISERSRLKKRKRLAVILNADGFGTHAQKLEKYRAFTKGQKKFRNGYKLFFHEDTDMMTPAEVMKMKPRPDFIVYE